MLAKMAEDAPYTSSARIPINLACIVVARCHCLTRGLLLTRIGRLDVASRLLSCSEMHVSSERLNSHQRGLPHRTPVNITTASTAHGDYRMWMSKLNRLGKFSRTSAIGAHTAPDEQRPRR